MSEKSHKTKGTWKARKERRAASKNRKEKARLETETVHSEVQRILEEPEEENMRETESELEQKNQPLGSVLAEKRFETLDGMLQAYEARLKPLETMEERYRSYPDPVIESRQLEIYKKLIDAMQTLDQIINKTTQHHIKQETDSHGEMVKQMEPETMRDIGEQMKLNSPQEEPKVKETSPKLPSNTSVPEVDEEWGNQLWEAVKKTYGKKQGTEIKPPIEEIDLE